jgi:hypothetical protein
VLLALDGALEWSYDLQAGDASAADDGYQVGATVYGLIASWLLFGAPIAMAQGDGSGTPHAELEIMGAVDNNIYFSTLLTLAYDVTLEQLLGTPAAAEALSFEGLVGATTEDVFRLDVDGTQVVFPAVRL